MIHYDDIKIGSVYKSTKQLCTTDLSELIEIDDVFTILSIDTFMFLGIKRYRIEILFNNKVQILLLINNILPFEKII